MTKIKCSWCGGTETPFHLINVYVCGNKRFICEKCYKQLEEHQRLYDNIILKEQEENNV